MDHVMFSVDESNGDVRFLVNDLSKDFVTKESNVSRASHVEPCNPVLRVVFYTLRYFFGEWGKVGEFTRRWSCLWRVNFSPINGPLVPIEWATRESAIEFEVEYLEKEWL